MLKIFLATLVLVIIAVAGLGIKMLFNKNAEFKGGSCQATASSDAMKGKNISCGCSEDCK